MKGVTGRDGPPSEPFLDTISTQYGLGEKENIAKAMMFI